VEQTSVSTEPGEGFVLCRIQGEVDIASAPVVRSELNALAQGDAPVILDLAGWTSSTPWGCRSWSPRSTVSRDQGLPLVLAAVQPRIREVVEVTGLAAILPLFDSQEEAVARVARPVPG
jgi:anti-anti-sigma factor